MKRSLFSLSHYKLLTFYMGYIVPLTWYEVLPGDTIQQRTSMLVRCNPLVAPVMHPVRIRIHHWFVPLRLIWEDFEDFITGGPDGLDASVHPYIDTDDLTSDTILESSLLDYLGLLPADYTGNSMHFSALPVRAYQCIYEHFYRDQDLRTGTFYDTASGADTTTVTSAWLASWEKDYFTTARPWAQKGTEVTVPIVSTGDTIQMRWADSSSTDRNLQIDTGLNVEFSAGTATGNQGLYFGTNTGLDIPIDELRLALALGRYQEARAAFGSRYTEYLRYLGVRSRDQRVTVPEYLGGGRQTIQFSEVLRTGNVDADTTYIGDMSGHGIGAGRSKRWRRFFDEHGIVMTLASCVPKTIYNNATTRGWWRTDKEDYFQRELQYIGDQAITYKEIMMDHSTPDATFGYQQRYDEYRHIPSTIAGQFRSDMNHWHLARIFGSDCSLNSTFTDCSPATRILADSSNDTFLAMANHSIQARRMLSARPMPKTF